MTTTVLLYGDTAPRTLPADFDVDALVKAISLGRHGEQFRIETGPRRAWRFTAGNVLKLRDPRVDYSGLDAQQQWAVAAA